MLHKVGQTKGDYAQLDMYKIPRSGHGATALALKGARTTFRGRIAVRYTKNLAATAFDLQRIQCKVQLV